VIRSLGNDATERLWSRHRSKELDPRIERVALRKLAILDAAETLNDRRVRESSAFLDHWLERDYRALGYRAVRVPPLAPAARMDFVLDRLPPVR
jgi:hypothetical protein